MAFLRKFILVFFIIFCALAITIVLHANVSINTNLNAKQSNDETSLYDSMKESNGRSRRAIFSTHNEKMDMIPFWATKVPYNDTYELFLNAYTAIITETSCNENHISIIVHLHKKNQNVDLACGTMNWIKQDSINIAFSLTSNDIFSSTLKMSHSSYAYCYMKLEGFLSNVTDINSLRLTIKVNNKPFQSDVIRFEQLKTNSLVKDNISACTGPLFGSLSEENARSWLQNLYDHGINVVHFYHRDNFTDIFRKVSGRAPKMYHHKSKLADHMMSHAYFDQNIWYAHCWLLNSHRTKWIINIDMDEYLTINHKKYKTLSDYVSYLGANIGAVNIPRVRYRSCNGTMSLSNREQNLGLMPCRSELGLEFQKSMYRPDSINNLDVHLLDLKDHAYSAGKEVTWKNNHDYIIDAYDGVLIKHVSPILSNQLLSNHNPKEFLIQQKTHHDDSSFIFQVVKCNDEGSLLSSNGNNSYIAVVNICYNKGKMDSTMKLETLSKYSLKMSKQSLSNKYILIFIDGEDEIINDGILKHELQTRWDSFQSDLLISTELTCMLGKECNQFYNNLNFFKLEHNDTASIYTGSCVMGSPKMLYKTLSNLLQHSIRLQLGANNINYAFHFMTFDKFTRNSDLIIKFDSRQSIFGSMTYSQSYSNECKYLSPVSKYFKNKYICYDQLHTIHNSDCCTNYDISWKMLLRMFKVFSDSPASYYSCNVFRSSGLKDNSMRLGTPYFFRDVTASLQHVPLVWTGHGPGKLILSFLSNKVKSCKMNKNQH